MTHRIATQTQIQIANHTIDGYKLNNDWFMSLRGLGNIVDKADSSPRDFIKSKWLQSRVEGGFVPRELSTEDNKILSVIPINIVTLYIRRQDQLGNPKAAMLVDALMNQSLELRLESSLPTSPAPLKAAVDEVVKKHDVQIERSNQLESKCQTSFQDWCLARRHNPALVHNYITELVVGRTAKDSKILPLCAGDKEYIGLDHYQSEEGEAMRTISEIKKALPERYKQRRKGFTYRDYVDVVFEEITKN